MGPNEYVPSPDPTRLQRIPCNVFPRSLVFVDVMDRREPREEDECGLVVESYEFDDCGDVVVQMDGYPWLPVVRGSSEEEAVEKWCAEMSLVWPPGATVH